MRRSPHGDHAVFENGLHRVFCGAGRRGWLPWQDEAVRNALSLAIDRAGIARSLRRGTVVPTRDFVPPALVGRSAPRPIAYAVERARAMMDSVASVHPRPWPELVLSTTSDYTDLCAALQYQWEAVGMKVRIDVVAPATHRERVANGKAVVFRKSWLADYPDAENFLSLFDGQSRAERSELHALFGCWISTPAWTRPWQNRSLQAARAYGLE